MGVGATLLMVCKAYAWAVTPSEPGGLKLGRGRNVADIGQGLRLGSDTQFGLRNGRGRNVADGGQGLRLGSDTQRTGGPEAWAWAQRC